MDSVDSELQSGLQSQSNIAAGRQFYEKQLELVAESLKKHAQAEKPGVHTYMQRLDEVIAQKRWIMSLPYSSH